jgi:hypothetical protein
MLRILSIVLALAVVSSAGRAQAPVSPDQLRLEFEREKWRDELALRQRELAFKEQELAAKRHDQMASAWTNPLVLAILAAAIAAIGNAVVATVNGRMQRRLEVTKRDAELALEATKAESTRILEMIKTDDTEKAAQNLTFLIDAGLVTEEKRVKKLQTFLKQRKKGEGPSLPAVSPRYDFEPTESLTPALQRKVERDLDEYIAYLDTIGFPREARRPRIKIYKLDPPNAQYVNGTMEIDPTFAADPYAAPREWNHHILNGQAEIDWWPDDHAYGPIESGLADYFVASFRNDSKVGMVIAKLLNWPTPYLRDMENDRAFSNASNVPPDNDAYHYVGEIWSGAFWKMRNKLGREVADPLLAQAWITAVRKKPRQTTPRSFVGAVLATANKSAPDHVDEIREIFKEREFPLPKAAA